jgi:hypothetical protein
MSEPRSSRRAKKAVNYEEPKPLSTREIRARMSQDSEEKKSRKRANSETSTGSSAKKPKASTTPAPKKPASKKTPRRLDDTLAAESSTKKKPAARTPKTPTSDKARARHAAAVSTEADESTKAARAEAKAWRDKYRALEKERVTQAEREKDRSDGRASRLEALCKEQERRLKAYEDLTGCSLKVFALEETEDEEVECVATSNFTDRRLEFRLEVPRGGAERIYFEAGAGAECLDEGMESSPIEFDRDQFPRFLSRILARVHRSEESAL